MLFGATGSHDFPLTTTAFDTTFNGGTNVVFNANGTGYNNGTDLYLAKFSASGSALIASTFVGGSENEGTNNSSTLVFNYGDYYRGEIQVDTAGNFYIASCTVSSDFPVTAGCAQPLSAGGMDGVIFKMSPDLSTMMWSTYLGGSADDGCYALTLDNASNIYTTGGTSSTNFPVTPGSFSVAYNGGITDGFITKISNTGASVLNSTFIGTPLYDQGFLIQLDNFFDVYIVGQSLGNMPVSAGAYSNPNSKQFIWKMNASLSSTLITTIFGNGNGQVNISPSAFLVDICGNIYVSGWGGNILTGLQTNGMPITADAFQPSTDGFNFYLFVLAPDATSLLYGTYFGGALSQEHVDGGTSRFDKKGIVYQAVCANCGGFNATNQHDDFPVTPGSWPNTGSDVNHNTQNYNCNMGVFKFDFQTAGVSADAEIFPNDTICAGESIQFNNESANAFNFIWDFGDGSPVSNQASPSHQYPNPGTYNVTLIAVDSTGCLFSDTSDLVVVVAPIPVVDIGNDTTVCEALNLALDAGTSGNIYNWSTGDSVQVINVNTPGNYWVEISNGNCNAADTISIQQIILDPDLGSDTNLCVGQTLELNAFEPGVTYLWSTGAVTSTIVVSLAGQYWVQIFSGPCVRSDTILVGYINYPVSSLPSAVVICPDDSAMLDPGGPATNYLWSTGDTTQTIFVSEGGTYSVTISNFQCTIIDSITAQEILFPVLGNDTSMCDGETATLDLSYSGATYLWSSGATTPTINVSTTGQYWGTVMFSGCTGSDTMNVSYISYPVIALPSNITICQNDSVLLDPGGPAESYLWSTGALTQTIYASAGGVYSVTASNFQCSSSDSTTILQINFPQLADSTLCDGQSISLNMFFPGASYLWSTNETTPYINVSLGGQYTVTATLGFCSANDTAQINFVPYPSISLSDSIDLCPNTTQLLDPGPGAGSYLWSTQEQTQAITVSAGGTYFVTASNLQCSVSDTVKINAIQPVSWQEEVSLCNMVKYTLEAGIQANSYVWSTGETGSSIDIMEEGNYWVVANTGSCVISDTVNITGGLGSGALWFPNSFTPNDNGLNDKFTGVGADITYFHLMIFNRWGEMIFETEKQDQGWDGFYKGSLVQQDVYVWKVKYKTKCTAGKLNSRIGHVTVVK
jgi:gliding motility-associated-like protein